MGETKVYSIRLPIELVARIDADKRGLSNRNAFIIEAIREKLNPVKEVYYTDREKKKIADGAKKIGDIVTDALMLELSSRKDVLSGMSNEDLMKLAASRLPKEAKDDVDVEADALSLKACLDGMPGMKDLTDELNRAKGELFKAEHERDMYRSILSHSKGKTELKELMENVIRYAVEYVRDLIARNNLPGFGDGGGISETERAEISRYVEMELKDFGKI